MKHLRSISTALLLASVVGCTRSVVLSAEDGSRSLRYQCGRVEPRAETIEDLQIVGRYVQPVGAHAVDHGRLSSAAALRDAFQARDYGTMELVVVQYICQHGYPDDL